jgi:hypothetical protein
MVTLTICIMLLLLNCMHTWARGILRKWSAALMKWSAIAKSFSNCLRVSRCVLAFLHSLAVRAQICT